MAHDIPRRPKRLPLRWADEAVRLYQGGATVASVGRAVGVTRERARQVLGQLGVLTRRSHHVCNEACAAVQAAPRPFNANATARRVGLSLSRVAWAASKHAIAREGRLHHVCGVICAVLFAGLDHRRSVRSILNATNLNTATNRSAVYGRVRSYHPDWPWPRRP